MGTFKHPPTITSTVTELVRPSSPTPAEHRHLHLSPLDAAELCIFTPVLLLYNPLPSESGDNHVAVLKSSLAKALVAYYPFAGRFAKGEQDGVPEIRCDDSGAFFTEAVVAESLDEIGGFEGCVPLSGMEAAGLHGNGIHSLDDHEEIPPLVVQITTFKCKSIALAVNWHHQVTDGAGGFTFLKAWSELALGLPITNPPDHRRHLLSPREPPRPTDSVPGFRLQSEQPREDSSVERWSKTATNTHPKKVEFTITPQKIQQLKEEEASGTTSFASGVLISAYLWKLVTKSRDLHRSETTTIYMVVDARKRLKDFPVNYFGNCIFVRPASCSVEDVLEMPLGHLAKLIHDSVGVVTDEYVRSIVDFIHVTGAEKLAWDRPHLATHDLQPTFWRFFPVYELDFGFGVPSYGGRNSPTLGSAGFAAVSPTPAKDGSVLISQFLYSDAADKLEEMLVV